MRTSFFSSVSRRWSRIIGLSVILGGTALAQVSIAALKDATPDSVPNNPLPVSSGTESLGLVSSGAPAISHVAPDTQAEAAMGHKFWDNENTALFATVAALSAADFAVTRANLQRGGKELDPVTRIFSASTAGLACNFAGETAGIIGLSYFFHKKGHHQLERITPMLNIGASSFAVAYDLSHH